MSFTVLQPHSLEEALEQKAAHGGEALALAGGTVLVPELTSGRLEPAIVLDLSRAGLGSVVASDGALVIGATTTYRTLLSSSDPSPALKALKTVAAKITGGPQTHNRATVGGSAAYANPSSDMPGALTALGAELNLVSVRGERIVAAASFFVDAFRTAAAADELLVSIRIPEPPTGQRFAYEKLKFCESSWPIATAACLVRADGSARVVVGACSAVPLVLEIGLDTKLHERIEAQLTEPWSDILAPGWYRRRVAPVVAGTALREIQTPA